MSVPDTRENRDECICRSCPSFPHGCQHEILYCSMGSSVCDVHAGGCLCPDCQVYSNYSLESLYFCNEAPEGESRYPIRKQRRDEDNREYQVTKNIRTVAATRQSSVSSMGSRKQFPFSLDDLHLVPAQVHRFPKNREEAVNLITVIGPVAARPLKSSSPILISGLSYGAVSKNVRLIISQVALKEKILYNTGEGGLLPEERGAKEYCIVQYSTGRFGITEELLSQAAGIEIRFGQGAYPGKGSQLPAEKMTTEIAGMRGLKNGEDADSPARHPDITNTGELKQKIEWLRSLSNGAPVGAKIGCGAIEKDISALVAAGVDFIAIDGFGAGTGATNDYVRENVGIPITVALPRAARHLTRLKVRRKISLIAGGNLRTSGDFVKCLALGADAVYIGTAVLIAIRCEQYRICHTGLCPTGVTTQDPALVARCDVAGGVTRLSNFIHVMNEEMASLTRIVGRDDVHDLATWDLVSSNHDLARIAGCPWMGDPGKEDDY